LLHNFGLGGEEEDKASAKQTGAGAQEKESLSLAREYFKNLFK